jgi:hypothetical protein
MMMATKEGERSGGGSQGATQCEGGRMSIMYCDTWADDGTQGSGKEGVRVSQSHETI